MRLKDFLFILSPSKEFTKEEELFIIFLVYRRSGAMSSFKELTALRAEGAVLRALKSGRPRKYPLLLVGLYRKFAPTYYLHLELAIAGALCRLQTMGRIRFTPNRKYQLVTLKK